MSQVFGRASCVQRVMHRGFPERLAQHEIDGGIVGAAAMAAERKNSR
jgi:hypothetical protein